MEFEKWIVKVDKEFCIRKGMRTVIKDHKSE